MLYLNLRPGHEEERAVQFFKSFSVDSMQKGKQILYDISKDQPYTSLNMFLLAAGEPSTSDGGYWGWKNLYWELLSNKYGVVAVHDQKTKKTKFVFRLPPIEDIHEEVGKELERLKKEREYLEKSQKQQKEFSRILRELSYFSPPPNCFQPVYPPCTMYGSGGQD